MTNLPVRLAESRGLVHRPHEKAGRIWPVAALAWFALTAGAIGQQPQQVQAPAVQPQAAQTQVPKVSAAKKPGLPPEDVSFETKDGVLMKATYYPGSHGKETVPVILVHGLGGNRQEMSALAVHLQSEEGGGNAVIVPDLRGHGDSLRRRNSDKALASDALPLPEFKKMVAFDMEAVKKFLMGKNNSSDLNIEKLCVVGGEMGAIIAANWSKADWSWPPLATGKQGQDVKALVLISPPDTFKGLRMVDALSSKDVKSKLAVLIAVGNADSNAVKAADKIFDQFERFHPDPAKVEDRDLEAVAAKTKLQGAKLVLTDEFGLQTAIANFIKARLAKQALPWKDRPNPLQ